MNRRDLVLAGLAAGGTALHTPVQVQKLFFLIDRNIAAEVEGPHFSFEPLDYGPFDRAVYADLHVLSALGFVEAVPHRTWTSYRLTPEGQERGSRLLSEMSEAAQGYIAKASHFVRSLSFQQLVAAIYRAYPEMKANSVFRY